MSWRRFRAEVEEGHKGTAICLPFDPAEAWGARPRHFVRGTIDGCPFAGEIGHRRGRFYTLLDPMLMHAAGVRPGDVVPIALRPREASARDLAEAPRLASSWLELAARRSPVKRTGNRSKRRARPS